MPQNGENGEPGAPDRVFEIGLVLAGAVSAGAYTAGVMDFLIEALEAWERAKAAEREGGVAPAERTVPDHGVRLRAVSGASAGAVTAAVAVSALRAAIEPVRGMPPPGAARNPLYESWVERAHIEPMLGERDLEDEKAGVRSLLDSSVLDEIARRALDVVPDGRPRPYIADPLQLFLTVTNLRGVPYSIDLRGEAGNEHQMALHGDHMHFYYGGADAALERKGAVRLPPAAPDDPAWSRLAAAALASSAFPGGLAPRLLDRPKTDYDRRTWLVSREGPPVPDPEAPGGAVCRCAEPTEILPDWPECVDADYRYAFLNVDGGAVDNEPLELARRALAGEGRNPRKGEEARRAVIMVDPFPNAVSFECDDGGRAARPEDWLAEHAHLGAVVPRVLKALLAQARFKAEELKLARDEDVYSRFVIAPARTVETEEGARRAPFALASGGLGGFAGFLSRAFRDHDYRLGRRNCQRFLEREFVLPLPAGAPGNPIVAGWSEAMKAAHGYEEDGVRYCRIIPLVGSAAREVPAPAWPRYGSEDLAALEAGVKRRANAVVPRLIRDYGPGFWSRLGARGLWWWKRGAAVRWIMERVQRDLRERGLMEGG